MVLSAILVRPIAYHRAFARIGGGATAGLFLSQCFYWSPRGSKDGWFYKSANEWEEETGLTVQEQRTARAKLKAIGVLEQHLKGVPATLFFRVNLARVVELLSQQTSSSNSTNYLREINKLDIENQQTSSSNSTNYLRDYTQTTQKPHTQKEPGVSVASRFTLKECRKYAESLRADGITNPGGYATKIYRSGEADELIEAFANEPKATATARAVNHASCPRCFGSGMELVEGKKGKGAKRCTWQP
jgi:hypothetical protein